jgi:hypothetical protein
MNTESDRHFRIAAVLVLTLSFGVARSETLTVYNLNDAGSGSLRQAILDNENIGGGSTIVFSNGVVGTITLTSGELFVGKFVTILGPGPGSLAVDGNGAGRVFQFSASNNAVHALITGLTITNGAVSGTFPDDLGGGIWNDHSTLTLSNCTITGNCGGNGPGGGIYNDASLGTADLTVTGSTISNNTVTNNGGGIYNYGYQGTGTVLVASSTVSGNVAIGSNTAGGGIWNDGNSGSAGLSITGSTISGNSAGLQGGAVFNGGASSGYGSLVILDSTFSGNSAGGAGAVWNSGFGGTATVTLGDVILKTGTAGANLVNAGGTITTLGYNLSSDSGGGFLTDATDRINTDPMLAPLAHNGGPTMTHALAFGSPAVDKGKSFGYGTDQRGAGRPFKFTATTNAPGGDGSDIGAFELQAPTLNIVQVGSSVVVAWPSAYVGFTLQFSTNIALPGGWVNAGGSAAIIGTQYQQTNGPISGNSFFRLHEN